MDDHREIIQRAVEARRKFLDTPSGTVNEARQFRGYTARKNELFIASEEACQAFRDACLVDDREQG